jgi:regulator of RNase E activity RraA
MEHMDVSDEVLNALMDIATPTIANALDDVGFFGVMSGLQQIVPGSRCVGRAVTVKEVAGERNTYTSDDFKKIGASIEAAAPGEILVFDIGGAEVSTFGGLATFAAKVKGLAGVIVDGGVRDREEMEEHGVPIFARHMTPLTGRTRLQITAVNETISCGGVRVRPGDIIVADGSGVTCIPVEHAEKVLELAVSYTADDKRAEAELAKGLSFSEVMAKFARI